MRISVLRNRLFQVLELDLGQEQVIRLEPKDTVEIPYSGEILEIASVRNAFVAGAITVNHYYKEPQTNEFEPLALEIQQAEVQSEQITIEESVVEEVVVEQINEVQLEESTVVEEVVEPVVTDEVVVETTTTRKTRRT